MLHQMLTGNAPYDTTTLTEYDINKKVVEEPLPRMRTYYKYVSDKVQKIVDKATAKEPGERYQTCDDFKKALHRVIYPPKIPKWVWTSVAAIVLLMIGGGVYFGIIIVRKCIIIKIMSNNGEFLRESEN